MIIPTKLMMPVAKNIKQIIDDNARLKHILSCIEKIEVAIKEQTFDSFLNNKILRTALSKWIEIIGEAANNITEQTKNKYPGIDWQKMIDISNHVLNEYYDIDYQLIWETASISIIDLKIKLENLNPDGNQ